MAKSLKIAIYSGEIPSTTFIERLIEGLSLTEHHIYLFGAQTHSVSYNNSVHVVTYTHNRIRKFVHLLKYAFLLTLFRSKDKRQLDLILKGQSKNLIYAKVKSYPVLWHRPDVFHLQWAKGLEEWAWVQDFGIKLVLSLRGAHINYSPIANPELATMYRTYFPKVDAFHAVSKAIAEEAEIYGAKQDYIRVVYSGLNLDTFKSGEKNDSDVFEILSIGRPHWIKGYTYALDCCKILKDSNFKFHYSIIGGANDIELEYQVQDLGLQNHVTLLGQKSFEVIKDSLLKTDLLLLSSTKEGVANVILEAMALKTLVLSTDCGGMEEVITHNVNGFLVPIRDSQAMAAQIIEISNLPVERIQDITSKAFHTIQQQHTETHMINGMLELYTNLHY